MSNERKQEKKLTVINVSSENSLAAIKLLESILFLTAYLKHVGFGFVWFWALFGSTCVISAIMDTVG